MAETKAEAAERMYPGITFDCALPQDWVKEAREKQFFDVLPHFVWGYPEGLTLFGLPLPLSAEGVDFIVNRSQERLR